MKLPTHVFIGPDQSIPVREVYLEDTLGYWDEAEAEIVIASNQRSIGKQIILLHELIHVVESKMLQAGVIKKRADHRFVTNLAGTLFGMLAASGLWKGVSKEAALEFFK